MLPGKLTDGNFINLIKKWRDMWNDILLDHLQSMRLVAGSGIRIQKLANATIISAERGSGGSSPSAITQDDDGGPFAVEIFNAGDIDTPEWKVKLFNSKSKSGIAGLVTIGSFRKECEYQEWSAKKGVVYLDATYDPETEDYKVIFGFEEKLPETKDEQRYILRIAEIGYDTESKMYIAHQIHNYGDIEVTGRWVK